MSRFLLILILNVLLIHQAVGSSDVTAKAALKRLMPNTRIDRFYHSGIEHLYNVHSGKNLFYYHAKAQALFFGEIYDLNRGNLSAQHRDDSMEAVLEENQVHAIVLNPDGHNGTLLEFMSLSCRSCKEYEAFISPRTDLKRIVFLVDFGQPKERQKIDHVLCSPTPAQAMHNVITGSISVLESCEHAEIRYAAHQAVAGAFGVSGTPEFVLNGRRIKGFEPQKFNPWCRRLFSLSTFVASSKSRSTQKLSIPYALLSNEPGLARQRRSSALHNHSYGGTQS